MFKKGFTLAEVLITLGIIGVVAALTTPALVQNIGTAKVGPSLAKAVSTFENANQTMLAHSEAGSITSLAQMVSNQYDDHGNPTGKITTWSPYSYIKELSGYMKIDPNNLQVDETPKYTSFNSSDAYNPVRSQWNGNGYGLDNGHMIYYIFKHDQSKVLPDSPYKNTASNQLIGDVYIDINGAAKPNKQAKDIFRFYLYNDGTLRPYGARGFDRTQPLAHLDKPELYWKKGGCPSADSTQGVLFPDTCAGSIFDNNMKVIYE